MRHFPGQHCDSWALTTLLVRTPRDSADLGSMPSLRCQQSGSTTVFLLDLLSLRPLNKSLNPAVLKNPPFLHNLYTSTELTSALKLGHCLPQTPSSIITHTCLLDPRLATHDPLNPAVRKGSYKTPTLYTKLSESCKPTNGLEGRNMFYSRAFTSDLNEAELEWLAGTYARLASLQLYNQQIN